MSPKEIKGLTREEFMHAHFIACVRIGIISRLKAYVDASCVLLTDYGQAEDPAHWFRSRNLECAHNEDDLKVFLPYHVSLEAAFPASALGKLSVSHEGIRVPLSEALPPGVAAGLPVSHHGIHMYLAEAEMHVFRTITFSEVVWYWCEFLAPDEKTKAGAAVLATALQ